MKNIFSYRLAELLKENNISKRALAQLIGVSAMSISDWSNGKVQPTAENIFIIADYFQVSTDYLLGRSDDFGAPLHSDAPQLTPEEKQLLSDWRGLAPPLRKVIKDMIATWQENTKFSSNKKNNL